jgi:hypothetical protein
VPLAGDECKGDSGTPAGRFRIVGTGRKTLACPIWTRPRRDIDTLRANCGQTSEQSSREKQWGCRMAFEIVAERESEIVRMKRDSSLMAIAKARVWASEGWNVTIVAGGDELPRLFRKSAPPLVYN